MKCSKKMYNLLVQFNIETATKFLSLFLLLHSKALSGGRVEVINLHLGEGKRVGPNIKTYYLPRSSPWRKYNPKNGDPARPTL